MAPIGLVLFIASMGIMEGKSVDSIQDKFNTVSLRVSSLPEGRVRAHLSRSRPPRSSDVRSRDPRQLDGLALYVLPSSLSFTSGCGDEKGARRQLARVLAETKAARTPLFFVSLPLPVIQVVNFRYMPLAYRVPFQSSCGVLWTL